MVGSFLSPSLQQCFGTQYHGTNAVSGFIYDVSLNILYALYPTNNYDIFLNVPLSVGQQFAVADRQLPGSYRNPNIPNPDDLLYGQTLGIYDQCILCETGAPLMTESGEYLTTNSTNVVFIPSPSPIPDDAIYEEDATSVIYAEDGVTVLITETA